MGSPTIVADINSPGPTSQLAARLLDVDPGRQRDARRARALPARDQLRHGATRQVFQLHPNGWKFDDGPHREARAAAGRPALRPQLERPGAGHGLQPRAAPAGARAARRAGRLVQDPAPKVVPTGYQLVAATTAGGYPRPKGATPLRVPLVPGLRGVHGRRTATHGPPLAFPLLQPAAADVRPNLTVGTPDANGSGRELGRARAVRRRWSATRATPATRPTCSVTVSLTDVRNAGGLSDYTGELRRSTDAADHRPHERHRRHETHRPGHAVRRDGPCAATPDTTRGATCSVSTTNGRAHARRGAGGQARDLGARPGPGVRRRPDGVAATAATRCSRSRASSRPSSGVVENRVG